jgi:hypothetical protein
MAARSPALARIGPEVARKPTPSSLRHDLGERRLAQTRRAEQQDVIQRLAARRGPRR